MAAVVTSAAPQNKMLKYTKSALSKARQRPKSAWSYYVQSNINGLDAELPFGERVKQLSTKWQALDQEEKEPFVAKYMESKKKFLDHRQNLSEEEKDQIKHWRKVRRDNLEGGSRRSPTPYIKFVQANKEEFSKYTGESKGKLATVSRQLSEKWKAMTPEEKAVYNN